MTREQYNTQRTKLMNDMRAAIDAEPVVDAASGGQANAPRAQLHRLSTFELRQDFLTTGPRDVDP